MRRIIESPGDIARVIREKIEESSVGTQVMSNETGINASYIWQIGEGHRKPSLEKLLVLLDYFNLRLTVEER